MAKNIHLLTTLPFVKGISINLASTVQVFNTISAKLQNIFRKNAPLESRLLFFLRCIILNGVIII